MLYPTIDELTKGKFNRYELSLSAAKCARIITNEYVQQREEAERAVTGNKETDKPINVMIDRELRDDKAVKIAIRKIYDGEYVIVHRQDNDDGANLSPETSMGDETDEKMVADESDLNMDETTDKIEEL